MDRTFGRPEACRHGTFVAGVLLAKRGSAAPAICLGCSLLVRSIFPESATENGKLPSATPQELAAAILEAIEAGTRLLNLSAAMVEPSSKGERALQVALDYAAQRGVVLIAAAGNQGLVGSSIITRRPWANQTWVAMSTVNSSTGKRPGHRLNQVTGANLEARNHRTQGTMTSRSKCRPLKRACAEAGVIILGITAMYRAFHAFAPEPYGSLSNNRRSVYDHRRSPHDQPRYSDTPGDIPSGL
jgi:subtilisin family serine protease